jgi:hypothetical protein
MEIHELKYTPHPSYFPNLMQCDFFLFGHVKRALQRSVFESAEELLDKMMKIVDAIQSEILLATFHEWINRFQVCIDDNSEYIEYTFR